MSTFAKDVLDCHNLVRSKHGVPELTLNDELSAHAQKWAEHLAGGAKFEHSNGKFNGSSVGENMARASKIGRQEFTGKEACQMWYSEIRYYNLKKPGYKDSTGHFTQMVWKDTKELGVGIAQDKGGQYYVVANYKPAGNYTNRFPENVLPIVQTNSQKTSTE